MKATISGRRYDTDRAICLGRATISASPRAGVHTLASATWTGGLFRAPRSGRHFIAGQGGYMTRWPKGGGIIEMTAEQALEWARDHLTAAEVADHFGEKP